MGNLLPSRPYPLMLQVCDSCLRYTCRRCHTNYTTLYTTSDTSPETQNKSFAFHPSKAPHLTTRVGSSLQVPHPPQVLQVPHTYHKYHTYTTLSFFSLQLPQPQLLYPRYNNNKNNNVPQHLLLRLLPLLQPLPHQHSPQYFLDKNVPLRRAVKRGAGGPRLPRGPLAPLTTFTDYTRQ